MGAYPIDPANVDAFRVLMATCYLMSLMGTVYALFGIVRTAATKLPIPRGNPLDPDLFPADITPKLYSFDGRWRKVQKIFIFSLIGLLFGSNWLIVQYWTYGAGDRWFGWGLANDAVVLVGHTVILLVAAGIYVRRALSHANRFPDLQPA
jgi:hypothetical protein